MDIGKIKKNDGGKGWKKKVALAAYILVVVVVVVGREALAHHKSYTKLAV